MAPPCGGFRKAGHPSFCGVLHKEYSSSLVFGGIFGVPLFCEVPISYMFIKRGGLGVIRLRDCAPKPRDPKTTTCPPRNHLLMRRPLFGFLRREPRTKNRIEGSHRATQTRGPSQTPAWVPLLPYSPVYTNPPLPSPPPPPPENP